MIIKIVTFSKITMVDSRRLSKYLPSQYLQPASPPLPSPPEARASLSSLRHLQLFICKYLCSDQIYCCIIKSLVTLQNKVHLGCLPLSSGHTTQFQTQAPHPSFPGFIRENYFLDIFGHQYANLMLFCCLCCLYCTILSDLQAWLWMFLLLLSRHRHLPVLRNITFPSKYISMLPS